MGTISINGRRMSEEVAKAALKQEGITPSKAHLTRLATLARDDGNAYLNRDELAKGAKALLKELHGGTQTGGLTPNKPIENVVKVPPASLARYQISVADDRSSITFDPRQPKNLLATRAMGAKSVNVGHTFLGGVNVSITGANGETSPFKDGKWVKKSFAEVLGGKKSDLDRLSKNGYDINAKRDMLVANTESDSSPTIFALRDLNIDKEAPAPKGGPNVRLAKTDQTRGFVAICSETTIEWFGDRPMITVKKPVIYLYPEKKTAVKVKVDVVGEFSAQYPSAKDGTWEMVATPDGTLFDPKTEKRYSYIFWEAQNPGSLVVDPAKAHLVRRHEVETFLDDASRKVGLNDKERTDFVSYWIAALQKNPVSVVQLLTGDECAAYAKMTVEPAPDAEVRLFMIFRAAQPGEKVGAPAIPELRRGKFTVVEWGGANLDE